MNSKSKRIFENQMRRYVFGLILQIVIFCWTIVFLAETAAKTADAATRAIPAEKAFAAGLIGVSLYFPAYYLWLILPGVSLIGFIAIISGDVTMRRRLIFFKATGVLGIVMSVFIYYLYIVCSGESFFRPIDKYGIILISGAIIQFGNLFWLFYISSMSKNMNQRIVNAANI